MNAAELLHKAERALTSARVLLDLGDVDGACNRAYYAMFDAARAALLATNAPTAPEIARTHSGLIAALSLHLVKSGLVPVEFGKAFNRIADLRLVADYTGDEVDGETARWAVDQSGRFVAAIRRVFPQASSAGEDHADD